MPENNVREKLLRPERLFLFVAAALLIWNLRALTSPPYWDAILGLFNQATWLSKHGFDLPSLWTGEPGYHAGGSRINPYSVLPPLCGVLYVLFRPEGVFFVCHLLTVFCGAAVFVLFFLILRDRIGCGVSLLWLVAAMCEPIWSGQMAAIYREVPLTAACAAAIYCVHKEKLMPAALWILLAFFIKPTTLILIMALGVWLALRGIIKVYWFGKRSRLHLKPVPLLVGTVLMLLVISQVAKYLMGWGRPDSIVKGFELFPLYCFFFFPSLALELLIIGITTVGTLAWEPARRRLFADEDRLFFSLFLLILGAGFWVAYAIFPEPCPRYATFIIFPMAAFLALNLPKRISVVLAVLAIGWGCANQYGRFYPRLVEWRQRSGESLERSREYLLDLEANMAICAALARDCYDTPIVCKWPFVQMLTVPEFGYVDKPLPNVYAVGIRPLYTSAKQYDPGAAMPPETLYVYVPNAFEHWDLFAPRLKPKGDILLMFADESLPGKIMIYRRAEAPPPPATPESAQ